MHFNSYGGEAARLAADLVNLPSAPDAEYLQLLLAERGVTRRALSPPQAHELWLWSRRLAACFGQHTLEERCRTINSLLDESASRPYVSMHDGQPHLHFSGVDADVAAHVRAVTAAGLAQLVCFAGPHRLGRCVRGNCGVAFVDTSRNGRRKYCTVRCANNDAVARHRGRHHSST